MRLSRVGQRTRSGTADVALQLVNVRIVGFSGDPCRVSIWIQSMVLPGLGEYSARGAPVSRNLACRNVGSRFLGAHDRSSRRQRNSSSDRKPGEEKADLCDASIGRGSSCVGGDGLAVSQLPCLCRGVVSQRLQSAIGLILEWRFPYTNATPVPKVRPGHAPFSRLGRELAASPAESSRTVRAVQMRSQPRADCTERAARRCHKVLNQPGNTPSSISA